jgi:hypothetical protein
MGKTQGEILFEQYLADRGLAFDYEADEGGRRPDYRLHTEPAVYCEVKDFEFGPADRAEMDGYHRGNRVGSKGPDALYGRIRDTLGKAAKQLRVAKGSPCAAVLYNAGSLLNFAPIFIGGAMFGDPAFIVPLNGEEEPTTAFTTGRMTAVNKNTTVSAVAVLSRTNANQRLIDETLAKLGRWEGPGLPSEDRVTAVLEAVVELEKQRPEAFVRVTFVSVHHNPFAVAPLPDTVFNGPNDRHFHYDGRR